MQPAGKILTWFHYVELAIAGPTLGSVTSQVIFLNQNYSNSMEAGLFKSNKCL